MTEEHVYEGLFILDSEQYARDPEGVSGQIDKTIESLDGKVRVSRLWEERKLAYPIKNHKRGTYWLSYFRLNTSNLSDLNRQFQLNGNILRFLLLNIDPRLEEALVEHALIGPVKYESEPPIPEIFDSEDEVDDEDDEVVVDAVNGIDD
ncbi:MAG: 30S ribosomal protein S6 [Planctomycetia bacterium]|nr:30S ribosomal protein S6 [Planctomycetia bacterium]